jgi:hypothetical protein
MMHYAWIQVRWTSWKRWWRFVDVRWVILLAITTLASHRSMAHACMPVRVCIWQPIFFSCTVYSANPFDDLGRTLQFVSRSHFRVRIPQTSTSDDQRVVSFGAATLFTGVRISWAWEETRYGLTGYALATAWTAFFAPVIAQSNSEPSLKRVSRTVLTPVDRRAGGDEKKVPSYGTFV